MILKITDPHYTKDGQYIPDGWHEQDKRIIDCADKRDCAVCILKHKCDCKDNPK